MNPIIRVIWGALLALLVGTVIGPSLAHSSTASLCANEFAAFFRPPRVLLPQVAMPDVVGSAYGKAARLEIENIQNLQSLQNAIGGGFHEALRGQYQGRDVFVKISSVKIGESRSEKRRLAHYLNELEWVTYLGEAGLGPKLIGIVEKDGYYGMVTEFIEGRHVVPRHAIYLPDHFRPKPALLERLQHISDVLERERIYAVDLQVRISETSAWVIDPEAWSKATTPEQVAVAVSELRGLRFRLEAIMMGRRAYGP